VKGQVARLKSSPPIIQKQYAEKKIDIVGGVYDIATGKVTLV
jgi:carbonic anhydrase